MINRLRLGVAATGGKVWMGGVLFVELFIRALSSLPQQARPEIIFILTDSSLQDIDVFRSCAEYADKVVYGGANRDLAGALIGEKINYYDSVSHLFSMIDIYFPLNSGALPDKPVISWIPDFQHCYLPDFFSPEERAMRDKKFREVADYANMIVFSSRAVLNDFLYYYPQSKAATHVLTYSMMPEESWFAQDPVHIQKQYELPDRFVLCCNQFWAHKNHRLLFEALALLRQQGREIHAVCTGKTDDYRWPDYFKQLTEYAKALEVADLVHILGAIPREDQIQLIRRSLCVVQPSLFEGLSLIVCEARALGKPIIVSDLPVHREQEYGFYFDPHSAQDLADKLDIVTVRYGAGPDLKTEELACEEARNKIKNFAYQCLEMVRKASAVFNAAGKVFSHPQEAKKTITIVTSLMPGNIKVQKAALHSWKKMGFSVASLNASDEMKVLKPLFPEAEFVCVARDARTKYGKPFIYFDDMMDYLARSGSDICGIVNSDIILQHDHLRHFIEREVQDSILFGCRIDVPALELREGIVNIGGYDYFFFNRHIMHCYPREEFCIGLPWWDYWAVICPIAREYRAKKIMTPVAFHLQHDTNWDRNSWIVLGQNFSKYVGAPFPVDDQTMIRYQRIVQQTIENKSEHINIPQK